jgi:hypothetical protein
MSYVTQTFVDNETVLSAQHLQHIEAGIVANETSIGNLQTAFANKAVEISDAMDAEVSARYNGDMEVQNSLDAEIESRQRGFVNYRYGVSDVNYHTGTATEFTIVRN